MTNYCMILAREKNGGIGLNNALPWHIPSELKHFKNTTTGHVVVVGRKTFESLPKLSNRTVKILTRHRVSNGISDIPEFIKHCKEDVVYIIGGAKTYRAWLPYITDMIITTIHQTYDFDTSVDDILPNFDHYVSLFYDKTNDVVSNNEGEPSYTITYYKKKEGVSIDTSILSLYTGRS